MLNAEKEDLEILKLDCINCLVSKLAGILKGKGKGEEWGKQEFKGCVIKVGGEHL